MSQIWKFAGPKDWKGWFRPAYCLVASFDGKKILLAPFAEVKRKACAETISAGSYIRIEKIPIEETSVSVSETETKSVYIPSPISECINCCWLIT